MLPVRVNRSFPIWPAISCLAALLVADCGGGGGGETPSGPLLEPFNVHMHLHAHSNHNGASRIASMQWHSDFAAENNADVLWWSDHGDVFDQTVDGVIDLTGQAVDPVSFDATVADLSAAGPVPASARVSRLLATSDIATPSVSADADALRISFTGVGPGWKEFTYELSGPNGRIKGTVWPRPLGSNVRLLPDMDCSAASVNLRCEIEVTLAWHRNGGVERQQKLIFVAAPVVNYVVVSDNQVRIETPLNSLELSTAAALLPDGLDNTVERIRVRMAARNGAELSAALRGFLLTSQLPGIGNQIDVVRNLANAYASRYAQTQHVGLEAGSLGPHLNMFLPMNADTDAVATSMLAPAAVVQNVHARGGLASFNHMFGTSSAQTCDTAGLDARIQMLVTDLLANRAYGADMLEVGYECRGDADLAAHLRAWDLLTVNGLQLTGTGVSDTHGNRWSETMLPSAFSTWILATGPDRPALLDGLRARRVFFGNQFLWDGTFSFRVGGTLMGGTLVTPRPTEELRVEFQPLPSNARVFVVQGLLDPADPLDLTYIEDRTEITGQATLEIDTTRPSFVRLEAYLDNSGGALRPLVFTNFVLINP